MGKAELTSAVHEKRVTGEECIIWDGVGDGFVGVSRGDCGSVLWVTTEEMVTGSSRCPCRRKDGKGKGWGNVEE